MLGFEAGAQWVFPFDGCSFFPQESLQVRKFDVTSMLHVSCIRCMHLPLFSTILEKNSNWKKSKYKTSFFGYFYYPL